MYDLRSDRNLCYENDTLLRVIPVVAKMTDMSAFNSSTSMAYYYSRIGEEEEVMNIFITFMVE